MKRHIGDGEWSRLVEVHVFYESIGIEKVVAGPALRKRGQRRGVEFSVDIFSRTEDRKLVVDRSQQRRDVAVLGVASAEARKRSRCAGLLVVISQVAGSRAVDLARIATESQRGYRQRKLCRAHFVFARGAVVDQNLVPVDLQVRGD